MPIENERYEKILGTAVARAQNAFDRTYKCVEFDNGEWKESEVTLDDYFQRVQDSCEKNFGINDDVESQKIRAVFAATHVFQAVYGACACEQIKSELDKIFNEKDNELLNGVTDEEKAALCQEMKDIVGKQVPGKDKLDTDGALAEESEYIAMLFNDTVVSDKKEVSLQELFTCMNWMNNQFINTAISPAKLSDPKLWQDSKHYPNLPSRDVLILMTSSVKTFADKLPEDPENTLNTPLVNYSDIVYDKHDTHNNINPKTFLDNYKKDPSGLTGLSDEEKEWASLTVDSIISDLHNTYESRNLTDKKFRNVTRKNNISFPLDNFMIDDESIVPNGEAETKPQNAAARIVGELLDGKDVVANPIGDNGELLQSAHVAPQVTNDTRKTFWDTVWELIEDVLSKVMGFSTEKKELNEFIESVNKTNAEREEVYDIIRDVANNDKLEEIRERIPFDKLNKSANVFNKVTKNQQKEKPAKELNGPEL